MAFKITTTGTAPDIGYGVGAVVFNDLGERVFTHPTINYNLETEFLRVEIFASADVYTAISSGWITVVDANNQPIDEITFEKNIVRIKNVVVVGKGGDVDYTNIADALDSITYASATDRVIVKVHPGIYTEANPLILKEYVSIEGSGTGTVIVAADPTKNLIEAEIGNLTIKNLTLSGPTDPGKALIRFAPVIHGGAIVCDTVIFDTASRYVIAEGNNTTGAIPQIVIQNSLTSSNALFDTAFEAKSGGIVIINGFHGQAGPGAAITDWILSTGVNTITSTASMISVEASSFSVPIGIATGTNAVRVHTSGSVSIVSTTFNGTTNGIYAQNIGIAPNVKLTGVTVTDTVTTDIWIEHPGTTGAITGSFNTTKILVDENSPISIAFTGLDVQAGQLIKGDLLQGPNQNKLVNLSDLLRHQSALGRHENNFHLSINSGLDLDIISGQGTVLDSTSSYLVDVKWLDQTITVTDDQVNYIYANEDGTISFSSILPDVNKKVILGKAIARNGAIISVENTHYGLNKIATQNQKYLRNLFGPIYQSGSIVSESVANDRELDITQGIYWYGANEYKLVGGTSVPFIQYYRSGVGWVTSTETVVNNTHYDNSGTLTALSSGYYARHELYAIGESETYILILSQAQYLTQTLAELGAAPQLPPEVSDSIVPIASIIVQEGNDNIVVIYDIRPRPGVSQPNAPTPPTDHSTLSGLSNDDHPQYLLVNGSREMTGTLNMGANNIVLGVGQTVDGVDVSNLANLVGLNADATVPTTGLVAISGVGAFEERTLTAGSSKITITNGNGVLDNPTIDVNQANIDHDLLLNFVTNKHIDHSTVSINAGTGLTGGGDITSSRTLSIATTGVTSGSYGSATQVPSITVNAQGQLTVASNTTIAITSSQITDFTEAVQDAIGISFVDTNSIDLTYNDSSNTISADIRNNNITGATVAPLSITSNGVGVAVDNDRIIHTSGTLTVASGTLTKTDDTNVTLTLGGTPSSALVKSVSLTLGWTGQLSVPRGGTGASSFTDSQVLYGTGTTALGSDSGLVFIRTAPKRLEIIGSTAQNTLRVGPAATDPSTAMAYLETNTSGADGLRCYFNSGTPSTSGYITYAYDGNTPYIRITDMDDDPPYIAFNTADIAGAEGTPGTYSAPSFSNVFGSRGVVGTVLRGFSWKVATTSGSTPVEVSTLGDQWFELPDGTTAQRPTSTSSTGTLSNGAARYNTTLNQFEGVINGQWWGIGGIQTRRVIANVSNSTTTAAKITALDMPTGTGTFVFQYFIRYRSSAAGTGIRFSVNHSGTVTSIVYNIRYVGVNNAPNGAASQTQTGNATIGAYSQRILSTTASFGTTSVDTADSDMLMIIEGIVVVTAAGDLQLYHASETATTTTVMQNSSLIVTKTN